MLKSVETPLRFAPLARVECCVAHTRQSSWPDHEPCAACVALRAPYACVPWIKGIVIMTHLPHSECEPEFAPYMVRLDDGRAVYVLEDTDASIRASEYGPAPRFAIGTRVECFANRKRGSEVWSKGRVVAHHYWQADFPCGFIAPYQIKLDKGKLIYAPEDSDKCIRRVFD